MLVCDNSLVAAEVRRAISSMHENLQTLEYLPYNVDTRPDAMYSSSDIRILRQHHRTASQYLGKNVSKNRIKTYVHRETLW
jgi:hypothetical protein